MNILRMQSMYQVYFARAIDGVEPNDIYRQASEVRRDLILHNLQMVDPFVEVNFEEDTNSIRREAQEIVERDLALLKTVDAVLMDCSIPGRSYIGCICELVYAYLWKIPVVVYVGSSGNDTRYWLQYHATYVCRTKDEAINLLIPILEGKD